MALPSPLPEHTHIEKPFQVNQVLENVITKKHLNTELLQKTTAFGKPFIKKLYAHAIELNNVRNNKEIPSLYMTYNPRVRAERINLFSFYVLILFPFLSLSYKNINV
jgi:hypothetical protein